MSTTFVPHREWEGVGKTNFSCLPCRLSFITVEDLDFHITQRHSGPWPLCNCVARNARPKPSKIDPGLCLTCGCRFHETGEMNE